MSLAPGCSMLAAARHLSPSMASRRSSLSLAARLALIPSTPCHASGPRLYSARPREHRQEADAQREQPQQRHDDGQAPQSTHSSSADPPKGLTGSDLLFLQAEREEISEANQEKANKAQQQRLDDPAWEGEERLQDTILRMLVDKHQPLKVRSETKPTPSVSSAPVTGPSSSSSGTTPEAIKPIFAGPLEGGRYLEKTPDGQPWNAVFVRPAHLQSKKFADSQGSSTGGSVYTGKYLAPRGGGGAQGPSGYAARLRAVGVTDVKLLPLDDAKKMKAIREALHRVERAGRIGKARDGAADYQRSKEFEVLLNKVKDDPVGRERDEEGETDVDGEHTTTLQSRRRSRAGPSLAAMSGRAWASLVNERIEEAMRGEDWKNNSLRGKPMAVDVHEWNPHVKGEERIMNRIVQRQGGAPPFVELNAELNLALTSFRKRLIQSWVRRASRIILSGDLKRGLEPLAPVKVGIAESESSEREESNVEEQGKRLALAKRVEESTATSVDGHQTSSKAGGTNMEPAPMLSTHAAPTAGQARLLSLAGTFRDREWEASEAAYHAASLGDLNKIVRRYNAEAPFTARRAPLVREVELERAYKEGQASLAQALSDGLIELRRGREEREKEDRERREGKTSRDLLARMAQALNIGWLDSKNAQPLPKGNDAPSRRPESGVMRQVEDDASLGGGPGQAGLGIDEGPDRKVRSSHGNWTLLRLFRRVLHSAKNLVGR